MWDNDAIDRLAATQRGLITFAQIVKLGVSPDQLTVALRSGRLTRVRRCVYRLSGAPTSLEQSMLATVMGIGDPVVLSHFSALYLWGLWSPMPAIEVTVPASRWPRRPGLLTHRTTLWFPKHHTDVDGLPVTNVARTLMDVSARLSRMRLQRIVDEAQRQGKLELGELVKVRATIPHGRGRRVARIDAVLHAASGRGPGRSAPELDVYELVVAAGYPPPRQNFLVQAGAATFELDLAWPDRMIAIEYDGEVLHGLARDRTRDRRKDRRLNAHGWVVLRADRHTETDELLDDLDQVWRRREPAPKSA